MITIIKVRANRKVIFNIIKDEQTAMIALQNGEIDLDMNISLEENINILENAGQNLTLPIILPAA